MRPTIAHTLWALGLFLIGCAPVAGAQEMAVSVEKQLEYFLKVLEFDRMLPRHQVDELTIAVLYQEAFQPSVETRNDFFRACRAYNSLQVSGLPLRVIYIGWQGLADLDARFARLEIAALYVTPLRGVPIGQIRQLCRLHQVTTLTGVPDYVKAGLSVGIGMALERPKVLINLSTARAEGADFSSQLLRLSAVVH
ncbi:MAG TPA: YfiR family protein [bacterium]|nr:YfiR family protein [bacterium]HQI48608.1 YfiR family protein [bacterium]HQJ63958.1 YfiR family protein [bacterium]